MLFLSRSILLDLPFNQPDEKNKQKWLDASGKEYSAIANSNCEASTLDFLGNCLRLNAGGELTFPKFDLPSQLEQLTLEFWAKPDAIANPDASNPDANTPEKYLLRGPINVWMQGNNLCWCIGSEATNPVHTINNVGDQLHHWAIVLNRTVDSAKITLFQDGVENTNYATELSTISEQLRAIAATDFVIGAASDGWTGRLAHLRLWNMALNAIQLQENKNRDITAHSAFKAANGIDWRLVNADDEPTLYIHSNRPQELRLEIENITQETTLSLPANPENASLDNSHIWLVLRPGTLASALLPSASSSPSSSSPNSSGSDSKFIQNIRNSNPNWDVSIERWNEHDCICFLRQENAKTLNPGERLTLYIPNVAAEPGPGSRPTQVMLKYQHLEIGTDVSNASAIFDGHRAQVINILYRNPASFYRKPPLEVGVVGAPVILNNGQEETSLTLYIKNFKRDEDNNSDKLILGSINNSSTASTSPVDKEPKFILEIEQTQTGSRFIETSQSELSVGEQFWYQGNHYTLKNRELSSSSVLKGIDNEAVENHLSPPPSHVLLLQEREVTNFLFFKAGDIFLHEGNYFQFEKRRIYSQGVEQVDTRLEISVRNGPPIICLYYSLVIRWRSSTRVSVETLRKGDKFWDEAEGICLDFEDYIPPKLNVADEYNNPQFLSPVPSKVHILQQQEDLPLDGFGDSDDLNQTRVEKTYSSPDINIQKMDSSGNTLRWKILPPEVTVQPPNSSMTELKKRGFHPDETIFLTIADLKTSAPAGRGIIRLRYEDFDKYGEGVFEIPIEKSPVIPARLKQGGAGFGLALGHDPRAQKAPNAEVLDEMLSIKQVGDGSALKIDNAGSGSGITIENAGEGSGLAVSQNGPGLAAIFAGGRGVDIAGALHVAEKSIRNLEQQPATTEDNSEQDAIDIDAELTLHLKLDGPIVQNISTYKCSCEIHGNLQVIPDAKLGYCLRFNGNEYIVCNGVNLASASFTIQFWAKRQEVGSRGYIIGQKASSVTVSERPNRALHIGFRDAERKEEFTFAFYGKDLDVPDQTDTDWHHWACVYDVSNKTRTVYRDGQVVGTPESNVQPYLGSGHFLIGKSPFSEPFKGDLTDIRVHHRALSVEEILLCKSSRERSQTVSTHTMAAAAHIEQSGEGSGLVVTQRSDALAAQFSGGSGVEITGNLTVGQRIRDKTGEIMPVGAVLPFAGAVAPEGWLLCNGQSVEGEIYQDLAKVLGGEEKKSFDENKSFNVPNYQERFLVGASGQQDYKLHNKGGAPDVRLEFKHLPEHKHYIDFETPASGGHNHMIRWGDGGGGGHYVDGTDEGSDQSGKMWGGDHTHKIQGETNHGGGWQNHQSHENRPPFAVLNYIIKY